MDYSKTDREILRTNSTGRLKGLPISLERVGGALYCRGMFPPKPGEIKPKQRRIAIELKAVPENLYEAVERCRSIGAQLIAKSWAWQAIVDAPVTTAEFIIQHQKNYLERNLTPGKNKPDTIKHWQKDFGYVFARLDRNKTPSISECLALIQSTDVHTRTRQRYVKAFRQLLSLAGIDSSSLAPLLGAYAPKAASPRDIPGKEAIIRWGTRVPDRWKFFYFLLASFGIRGTEAHPDRVDICDLEHREIKVWAGKSGNWRFVPACSDEIFTALVCTPRYPDGNQTPSKLSADFGEILASIACPFTPYALRHFWAFETLRQGWDTAWSAKCMGHSVKLHQDVYWMGIDAKMSREIISKLRQSNRLAE